MPNVNQRRDWEDLSVLDPYWAILSDPSRRMGGWDLETFMRSGRDEVAAVLAEGRRFGLPHERGRALDFGCGAGRLTRALADEFEDCLGVDISEPMIDEAQRVNADVSNCHFALNAAEDLSMLATSSFDLVLSRIVLQHVPSAHAKARYVSELVRVLRPGGMLALQLPSRIPLRHRVQPRPRLYGALRGIGVSPDALYHRLGLHPIRMTALPVSRVGSIVEAAGGQVVDASERAGEGGATSAEYIVTKP